MARSSWSESGHMGEPRATRPINKYMVFGDRVHEIKTVVVHSFQMGDVEDPDLYAAEPLIEWQNTEMGKFVMSKAIDTPEWHRFADPTTFGYQFRIVAKLKDVDYTFWVLKWGSK